MQVHEELNSNSVVLHCNHWLPFFYSQSLICVFQTSRHFRHVISQPNGLKRTYEQHTPNVPVFSCWCGWAHTARILPVRTGWCATCVPKTNGFKLFRMVCFVLTPVKAVARVEELRGGTGILSKCLQPYSHELHGSSVRQRCHHEFSESHLPQRQKVQRRSQLSGRWAASSPSDKLETLAVGGLDLRKLIFVLKHVSLYMAGLSDIEQVRPRRMFHIAVPLFECHKPRVCL